MSYWIIRQDQPVPAEAHMGLATAIAAAEAMFVEDGVAVEVVKVDSVRTWPRLMTEEERESVKASVDFSSWASESICGDGLELDEGCYRFDLSPDEEIWAEFVLNGIPPEDFDDPEDGKRIVREACKAFPGLADRVIAKLRWSEEYRPGDPDLPAERPA